MMQDSFDWQQVHLVVITGQGADQDDRARLCCDGALAAGLASAVHIGPDELHEQVSDAALPPAILADARATFRAAVPHYLADHLRLLAPNDIMIVQIIEDACDRPIFHADADMQALVQQAGKAGMYGQALCWPHDHHVRTDCLVLMDADGGTVRDAPYALPSPAIYARTEQALYFLDDWSAQARNPSLSLPLPDVLAPSSTRLRDHEGGWAIGSVLAHLRGLPVLSIDPTAAVDDPDTSEARLTRGGMRLAEAAQWLAQGSAVLTTDAAADPTPDRLRAQVRQMLASRAGYLCDDHFRALISGYRDSDLLFAALTSEDTDRIRSLRTLSCSQLNILWAEQVLDARPLDVIDMYDLTRRACLSALIYDDSLKTTLLGTMVWIVIGQVGRREFRKAFGRWVTSGGRSAMRRFVSALSDQEIDALMNVRSLDAPAALDMGRRMSGWIAIGG